MPKISEFFGLVATEARPDYRLWVQFEDGVEGEVDLSDVAPDRLYAEIAEPANTSSSG